MARTLKHFAPPKSKGRKPTYPWERWFNGKTWQLSRGQDFTCEPTTLQRLARKTALAMGKSISVFFVSPDQLVICPRNRRAAG